MSCPHSLAKGSRSRCRPMTTSADVDLCGTDRRTGSWERHASSPCTTTAYDPQGVDHPRSRHRSPASKGSCRHRARTPRVGDLSHLVTTSVRTAHRPLCAHHAAHGPRSSFASWRTSTFSTTTASTPTEPTSLPSFARPLPGYGQPVIPRSGRSGKPQRRAGVRACSVGVQIASGCCCDLILTRRSGSFETRAAKPKTRACLSDAVVSKAGPNGSGGRNVPARPRFGGHSGANPVPGRRRGSDRFVEPGSSTNHSSTKCPVSSRRRERELTVAHESSHDQSRPRQIWGYPRPPPRSAGILALLGLVVSASRGPRLDGEQVPRSAASAERPVCSILLRSRSCRRVVKGLRGRPRADRGRLKP